VIEGSPAAAAGLREGDLLLELDGRKASEMSISEITRRFEADGDTCVVRIRRGAEEAMLKIALRRIL